jgi:hypothetical protein
MTKALPQPQKAFNKVCAHLTKQMVQSLNQETDECMYRGLNGKMCAVGPFIADKHYSKQLEGSSINDERVVEALCASGWDMTDDYLMYVLSKCQDIHDMYKPKDWKMHLRALADELSYKKPLCIIETPDH